MRKVAKSAVQDRSRIQFMKKQDLMVFRSRKLRITE